MRISGRLHALTAGSAVVMLLLAGCDSADTDTPAGDTGTVTSVPPISTDDLPAPKGDEVHLFGFNDFHGNLEPPAGSNGSIAGVPAGGAAFLATHLDRLRAAYPASVTLLAGDNIGASPLVSSLFNDEPTVTFLNEAGVDASSVGNHEFDSGTVELTRIVQGGCAPSGCSPGEPYTGTRFTYLAANVADASGALPPGLKPWTMVEAGGHKIGVVGVVTPDTANIVLPEGIRGYTFSDEVEAINRYVPDIKAAGAETVVAVLHDGGVQQPSDGAPSDYNGCANVSPPVDDLATKTDRAVSVMLTGHSHQPYVCTIAGKTVTQAASNGRLITDVTMRFGDAGVQTHAVNRIVTRDVTPDPETEALVAYYAAQAAPRAERVVGTASTDVTRAPYPGGDSALGNLVADSMLAATRTGPGSAVAAFMNPGGVRADLAAGEVTYGETYSVLPFGNQVITLSLTGQEILNLLEQQWNNVSKPATLAVAGIGYTFGEPGPDGRRVIADTVRIGDAPLDPVAQYRVSTNNFLASGGDGFTVFTAGTDPAVGPSDLDALESYLAAQGAVTAPAPRIEQR